MKLSSWRSNSSSSKNEGEVIYDATAAGPAAGAEDQATSYLHILSQLAYTTPATPAPVIVSPIVSPFRQRQQHELRAKQQHRHRYAASDDVTTSNNNYNNGVTPTRFSFSTTPSNTSTSRQSIRWDSNHQRHNHVNDNNSEDHPLTGSMLILKGLVDARHRQQDSRHQNIIDGEIIQDYGDVVQVEEEESGDDQDSTIRGDDAFAAVHAGAGEEEEEEKQEQEEQGMWRRRMFFGTHSQRSISSVMKLSSSSVASTPTKIHRSNSDGFGHERTRRSFSEAHHVDDDDRYHHRHHHQHSSINQFHYNNPSPVVMLHALVVASAADRAQLQRCKAIAPLNNGKGSNSTAGVQCPTKKHNKAVGRMRGGDSVQSVLKRASAKLTSRLRIDTEYTDDDVQDDVGHDDHGHPVDDRSTEDDSETEHEEAEERKQQGLTNRRKRGAPHVVVAGDSSSGSGGIGDISGDDDGGGRIGHDRRHQMLKRWWVWKWGWEGFVVGVVLTVILMDSVWDGSKRMSEEYRTHDVGQRAARYPSSSAMTDPTAVTAGSSSFHSDQDHGYLRHHQHHDHSASNSMSAAVESLVLSLPPDDVTLSKRLDNVADEEMMTFDVRRNGPYGPYTHSFVQSTCPPSPSLAAKKQQVGGYDEEREEKEEEERKRRYDVRVDVTHNRRLAGQSDGERRKGGDGEEEALNSNGLTRMALVDGFHRQDATDVEAEVEEELQSGVKGEVEVEFEEPSNVISGLSLDDSSHGSQVDSSSLGSGLLTAERVAKRGGTVTVEVEAGRYTHEKTQTGGNDTPPIVCDVMSEGEFFLEIVLGSISSPPWSVTSSLTSVTGTTSSTSIILSESRPLSRGGMHSPPASFGVATSQMTTTSNPTTTTTPPAKATTSHAAAVHTGHSPLLMEDVPLSAMAAKFAFEFAEQLVTKVKGSCKKMWTRQKQRMNLGSLEGTSHATTATATAAAAAVGGGGRRRSGVIHWKR